MTYKQPTLAVGGGLWGTPGAAVQRGFWGVRIRKQQNLRKPVPPYRLVVWKQECKPTRKGLLDACSNTCFSVCTQSIS